MSQAYSKTGIIWVWLTPDPEETEDRVWTIAEQACCDDRDVRWLEAECDLESELQDAIADEGAPEGAAGVLVSGHLYSERIESMDYGTDYDGGFEIAEMFWLYEPKMEPMIPESRYLAMPGKVWVSGPKGVHRMISVGSTMSAAVGKRSGDYIGQVPVLRDKDEEPPVSTMPAIPGDHLGKLGCPVCGSDLKVEMGEFEDELVGHVKVPARARPVDPDVEAMLIIGDKVLAKDYPGHLDGKDVSLALITMRNLAKRAEHAEAAARQRGEFLISTKRVNVALKNALDGDESAALAGALADGEAYGRTCERGRRMRGYLPLAQVVAEVQVELEDQLVGHAELEAGLKRIWAELDKVTTDGVETVPVEAKEENCSSCEVHKAFNNLLTTERNQERTRNALLLLDIDAALKKTARLEALLATEQERHQGDLARLEGELEEAYTCSGCGVTTGGVCRDCL